MTKLGEVLFNSKRFLSRKTEVYFAGPMIGGTKFPVYKDPDAAEIKEIYKNPPHGMTTEDIVRFAFTADGVMYAWHHRCFHIGMERGLGITWAIQGTAVDIKYDLKFELSPATVSIYFKNTDLSVVGKKLKNAFPNAQEQIDDFILQLQASLDMDA